METIRFTRSLRPGRIVAGERILRTRGWCLVKRVISVIMIMMIVMMMLWIMKTLGKRRNLSAAVILTAMSLAMQILMKMVTSVKIERLLTIKLRRKLLIIL